MLCPKMSSYSPFKTRRRSVRQRCAPTGSYRPKRESGNCNSRHAVHFSFSPLAVSLSDFLAPANGPSAFRCVRHAAPRNGSRASVYLCLPN
ncbi:hypothetical protein J3E68DRAFT_395919 [Trichoderma sp. SZMC 28012]